MKGRRVENYSLAPLIGDENLLSFLVVRISDPEPQLGWMGNLSAIAGCVLACAVAPAAKMRDGEGGWVKC